MSSRLFHIISPQQLIIYFCNKDLVHWAAALKLFCILTNYKVDWLHVLAKIKHDKGLICQLPYPA